jgi:hypothetical protein
MRITPYLVTLLAVVALDSGTAVGAPPATPMVMDLVGNGIDLGGQTTTSLFGPTLTLRWTKPSSDDAFLVIDATALRKKGYDWRSPHGPALTGNQIVRGGTRLVLPGGAKLTVSDSWHLLGQLDANGDGMLSAADPVWTTASVFNDGDANGKIDPGELMALPVSGVASISLSHAGPTHDDHGNTFTNGTYRTASGAMRTASGVTLASGVLRPAGLVPETPLTASTRE